MCGILVMIMNLSIVCTFWSADDVNKDPGYWAEDGHCQYGPDSLLSILLALLGDNWQSRGVQQGESGTHEQSGNDSQPKVCPEGNGLVANLGTELSGVLCDGAHHWACALQVLHDKLVHPAQQATAEVGCNGHAEGGVVTNRRKRREVSFTRKDCPEVAPMQAIPGWADHLWCPSSTQYKAYLVWSTGKK